MKQTIPSKEFSMPLYPEFDDKKPTRFIRKILGYGLLFGLIGGVLSIGFWGLGAPCPLFGFLVPGIQFPVGILLRVRSEGGLRRLFDRFVDRDIVGYDGVYPANGKPYTERHGQYAPEGAHEGYSVHVKLGGWGGKRVFITHNGEEVVRCKKLTLSGENTVTIHSYNGDHWCISIQHLLRLLTITDLCDPVQVVMALGHCIETEQRIASEKLERLRGVIYQAGEDIDATRRFMKSKEAQSIRQRLHDALEYSIEHD